MDITMCAICEHEPAVDRGEHVWPAWYLRHLDMKGRPIGGWSINGEPMLDRNDRQVHPTERQRVFLDACRSCNQELNRRFEVPAKPIIKDLVDAGWAGEILQGDLEVVGLWFAKVLLLLGHPRAHHSDSRFDFDRRERFVGPGPDLSWLVTDAPAPADLSLWVFNADTSLNESMHEVVVPRIPPNGDGGVLNYLQVAEDGICASLLWHPGWPVSHPLVAQGFAWELLHGAPEGGDISQLPRVSYNAVSWIVL